MKGFLTFSCFILHLAISGQSIAIQEVLYDQTAGNDKFELVNNTGGSIDVSAYFTCTRFNYFQLGDVGAPPHAFSIIQGNLVMPAGSHLKMKYNTFNLNNVSGDFCIYTDGCFTCTTSMVDFLQYGTSDPSVGRGTVAIAKGIWRDMDPGAPVVMDFIPTVSTPGHSTNWDGSNGGGGELTFATDFVNGPATLPISLLTLSGKVNMKKQVELSWIVLDEFNSKKHVVEKSRNGQEYKVIGEIVSQNLGSTPGHYYFLDEKPVMNEFNYYRVRQIDFDGTQFTSSSVYVNVKNIDNFQFVISPMPLSGSGLFNLELYWPRDEEVVEFRILDLTGRIVDGFSEPLSEGYNIFMHPLNDLQPGQYLMVVSGSEGDYATEKFVVAK